MEDEYNSNTRTMDKFLSGIMNDVFEKSKKHKIVKVENFNRKNKAHLLILKAAGLVCLANGWELHLKCNLWDWFRIRKLNLFVQKHRLHPHAECNIDVSSLIREAGDDVWFYWEIYNEYYAND